jgi:hypothetical protein
MNTEIIEQFNTFWRNYQVDERLFPRRRAATLKLWVDKPPVVREAMLKEVAANGGPKRQESLLLRARICRPRTNQL